MNYWYSSGAKRPRWGGERARGRISQAQGANKQGGETAQRGEKAIIRLCDILCMSDSPACFSLTFCLHYLTKQCW